MNLSLKEVVGTYFSVFFDCEISNWKQVVPFQSLKFSIWLIKYIYVTLDVLSQYLQHPACIPFRYKFKLLSTYLHLEWNYYTTHTPKKNTGSK